MAQPRIKGGIGADAPFWDALEAGELRIPRCAGCERWMWPAHFRCGVCGSWELRWDAVEPVGTIYAWTRNHLVSDALKERRPELPYVTMLVALPQAGGVRLPGALSGDERGLAIGATVRGRIRPASAATRGYTTMTWQIEGQAHG